MVVCAMLSAARAAEYEVIGSDCCGDLRRHAPVVRLRVAARLHDRPGDACNLVGKGTDGHISVSTLSDLDQPTLQGVVQMLFLLDPYGSCPLNEQPSEIAVATFRDVEQAGFTACVELPWHDADPRRQVARPTKIGTITNGRHDRRR